MVEPWHWEIVFLPVAPPPPMGPALDAGTHIPLRYAVPVALTVAVSLGLYLGKCLARQAEQLVYSRFADVEGGDDEERGLRHPSFGPALAPAPAASAASADDWLLPTSMEDAKHSAKALERAAIGSTNMKLDIASVDRLSEINRALQEQVGILVLQHLQLLSDLREATGEGGEVAAADSSSVAIVARGASAASLSARLHTAEEHLRHHLALVERIREGSDEAQAAAERTTRERQLHRLMEAVHRTVEEPEATLSAALASLSAFADSAAAGSGGDKAAGSAAAATAGPPLFLLRMADLRRLCLPPADGASPLAEPPMALFFVCGSELRPSHATPLWLTDARAFLSLAAPAIVATLPVIRAAARVPHMPIGELWRDESAAFVPATRQLLATERELVDGYVAALDAALRSCGHSLATLESSVATEQGRGQASGKVVAAYRQLAYVAQGFEGGLVPALASRQQRVWVRPENVPSFEISQISCDIRLTQLANQAASLSPKSSRVKSSQASLSPASAVPLNVRSSDEKLVQRDTQLLLLDAGSVRSHAPVVGQAPVPGAPHGASAVVPPAGSSPAASSLTACLVGGLRMPSLRSAASPRRVSPRRSVTPRGSKPSPRARPKTTSHAPPTPAGQVAHTTQATEPMTIEASNSSEAASSGRISAASAHGR